MSFKFKKIFGNEVFKNIMTLFSGSTLAQLIPFLIYPLLSRLYTPEEFGTLALFSSLMVILSIFSTLKYDLAIMLPEEKGKAINIAGFCLFFIGVFWVLISVIVLIFGNQITQILGDEGLYPWIYLLPFSVVFFSSFQVLTAVMNRQKSYTAMATSRVLQSITASGTKLSGGFLKFGSVGLIIGSVFGHLVSSAYLFIRFIKSNKNWLKIISKRTIKEQLIKYNRFPKFSMLHFLFNSLSAALPIFIFTRFFTGHDTGLYSMSYNLIFIPVSLFSGAVGQVLYQNISEKFNLKQRLTPLVKDTTITIALVFLIPFAVLFVFSPAILGFVLGEEWSTSGEYQRIILPWLFMVLLSAPLSFIPNIFGRQKKTMLIEFVSFVFRFIALYVGAYFNDILLGLVLFSIVSFTKVSYYTYWCFYLLISFDKKISKE